MTNTQPLPAPVEEAADTKQYSLTKILAIWASVTVPSGGAGLGRGPGHHPLNTSLHPGLVHWMLMVVGMMWQFVVSLAVLRHELGGLRWLTLKRRIWLNLPRSPRTGKPRGAVLVGPAGLRCKWSGRISVRQAGCGVDQLATRL